MVDSTDISTYDATVDLPVALSDSHTLDVHPHTVHVFFSMCKRGHVHKKSEGGRKGGREGCVSRERRELSPVLHNVCLEPSALLLHV